MNAISVPPDVANIKIKNPKLFIFFVSKLVQSKLSCDFVSDDLLTFLETTTKEIQEFEKNNKLPVKWIFKLAESEEGIALLNQFKEDIPVNYLLSIAASQTKNDSTEKKIINKSRRSVMDKDKMIVLKEAECLNVSAVGDSRNRFVIGFQGLMGWNENGLFIKNIGSENLEKFHETGYVPPEWRDMILDKGEQGLNLINRFAVISDKTDSIKESDPDPIIAGSRKPKGKFIHKKCIGKILEKILQISNLKSDSEIGSLIGKGHRNAISAMRKGEKCGDLYLTDISRIMESDHVFCSGKDFLDFLGLLEYFPEESLPDKKDATQIIKGLDSETIIGGYLSPKGYFISKDHVKEVLDVILKLSKFKSDNEIGRFLSKNIVTVRQGRILLYMKEVAAISESDQILVPREGFLAVLGLLDPVLPEIKKANSKKKKKKPVEEKLSSDKNDKPTGKGEAPSQKRKLEPNDNAAVTKGSLPKEIEDTIRMALLMTGSIGDSSIRVEFFTGCLSRKLLGYTIESTENTIIFRKDGEEFMLDLAPIPFEFK